MLETSESVTGECHVFDSVDAHVERTAAPRARFSLMERMFVERGDKSDWDLLHDLHYKAEKLPPGPKFWRLALEGETIGVLVTSTPRGMVRERHIVFPNIKPGAGETRATNTARYNYLNANFRLISRFVVDTMYRGIGCGYRMMNLVTRLEGAPIMEIQSSMSKFNMFGQRAGFRFVKPMNANKYEAGMKFFRLHFEANPQDFEAIVAEIEAKPEPVRERLLQDCRGFYLKNSSLENTGSARVKAEARVAAMDARHIVKAIQQVSLASPMYGVMKNPDVGRSDLPTRLPLTAFDLQPQTAKLRTDLL